MSFVPKTLQQEVWQRAGGLCEYCRLPERLTRLPFQIDHVIAEKHGGRTALDNLALSCLHCNAFKGPNIAGIDGDTGEIVRLFQPPKDSWPEHFYWEGPALRGKTPLGRATISVLEINLPSRVALREALIEEGVFPL